MDDGSPAGYIILIVLLILGGAYFAATETALASANRIRMMSLADNGDKRAKRVLYILDHFDKALTTILIGNNIMHIGCASTATLMATKLWGMSAVTATTVVTTMVVFLTAEMLPKRFAKACNEKLALGVSGSLLFLMKLLAPVSAMFTAMGDLVKRPFKKHAAEEPTVTEEELYDILETVASEGSIDEDTTELVQNALEFSDTVAQDILTPWDRVAKLDVTMTDERILEVIRESTHSRLPVVDVHGAVIGMLQIRKYLKAHLSGSVALMKVMDPPRYVDAYTAIDELLPSMSAQKTQIAVVRDGENKVLGVVSVEDILEELVGEIYDEDDRVDVHVPEGSAI